ncbi:bola-like protein-domain-containing protein [Ochromonadaceae sp. CCMP2298]|nr:bola-like protein-domain-containing protein [Ochromonadaceae sp. CCMP2298]
MDAALKVDANKVPGCLSVVHVHATMSGGDNSQDPQGNQSQGTLTFQGDSDSQLTKGLVTMLVRGLSGHTAEEIEAVDPRFIQYAGVAQSLTPGRNNGFLNMLGLMKRQARALADGAKAVDAGGAGAEAGAEAGAVGAASGGEGGPMQRSIRSKLSLLQPQLLEVEDESYKHAGHAGVREMQAAGVGAGGETHFNVKVVATCFGGLSRVQRHQMVYTLLRAELDAGVHALSIVAKTPDEV